MLDILLFEMLFFISALISFWQVLFTTGDIREIHLVFVAGVIVALLAGHFGRQKKRWLWLILLLIPIMLFISSLSLRWSIPVLGLILWRYLVDIPRPLNELDYSDKFLVISFLLTGLVILRDNTTFFLGETAPVPIYLPLMYISGIFFLRSLRHHRTGQSQSRIRRANIFYLATIGFTYLISQFQGIRGQLRNIGGLFYRVVMNPINHVLDVFINWLFAPPDFEVIEEAAETVEAGGGEAGMVETWTEMGDTFQVNSLIGNIIMAIFLIVAVYFIYRLYIQKMNFSRPSEQSDDIREHMMDVTPKKRRFQRERFPESPDDQVRYYYRRFLTKLTKERELDDTSTDLDVKAKQLGLDSHPLSQIYREVRYGERVADKALVEEMKRLAKNLS